MSLTSTETADTLSTSLVSPSTGRESTKGQTQLRRRMHTPATPSSSNRLNGSVSPQGEAEHAAVVSVQAQSSIQTHIDSDRRRIDHLKGFANSEGEDESNSSDELHIGVASKRDEANRHSGSPKREKDVPRINTTQLYASYPPDNMSPNSRSWYEFDLSVVVALISPIGNWLTGGDHVKNLLLILLLIFYLHQIIEIPWALYHKSRPRRSLQPSEGPAEPRSIKAGSELRTLELLFLTLTVTSPFFGAMFLRYVITLVSGRDALSWFSTALFILATGIRPWRHLVERLSDRTRELHDVIHYPPTPNNVESKVEEMFDRIVQLEASLEKSRDKLTNSTDEMYDYVDDAVESVEITCRKHDKRFEKQDAKLKELEDAVIVLKKSKEIEKKLSVKTYSASQPSMALLSLFPSWLGLGLLSPPRTPTRARHISSSSSTSKHSLRTYPSNSSVRLESIPEEDTKPPLPPSSTSFQLRVPGAPLVLRWGDLATLPLRRVVHYLLTRHVRFD